MYADVWEPLEYSRGFYLEVMSKKLWLGNLGIDSEGLRMLGKEFVFYPTVTNL